MKQKLKKLNFIFREFEIQKLQKKNNNKLCNFQNIKKFEKKKLYN